MTNPYQPMLLWMHSTTNSEEKIGDRYMRFPFGFTPDGNYMYVANVAQKLADSTHSVDTPILSLVRTETWEVARRAFVGDSVRVHDVTPDSRYLIDYAYPGTGHPVYLEDFPVLRIWSIPELEVIKEIGPIFQGEDTASVVSGRDGKHVYVFDMEYDVVRREYFDGDRFLFHGKRYSYKNIGHLTWQGVRKVDLATGEIVRQIPLQNLGYPHISVDDRYIFVKGYVEGTNGQDQNVEIYDERSGELVEEIRFPSARFVLTVAMDTEGKRVALAYGREVWIWDIRPRE
ncbi:MAG: hypothetical protein M5U09_05150 [Gammaproteobacteria bacterium]|nr:hypothetical protein [Gammaproteobacteria bacterium]